VNKNIFLIAFIGFLSFNYIKSSQTEEKSSKEAENIEALNKELFDNAIAGNLAAVERLLQQGADPDGFKKRYGQTVLNAIAFYPKHENVYKKIAYRLIQNGADVNSRDNHIGFSPLFGSILSNFNNIPYGLLIKVGANINLQDNDGNTVLMRRLSDIISIINQSENPKYPKELLQDLPRVVNIVLFKTNLEYNLDLVNKKGHNVDYYVNRLPENTRKWVKKAIKKFKQLKARKKACINESLQKGNVIPDLCNIVHEYLDGNGNIVKETELKEQEE